MNKSEINKEHSEKARQVMRDLMEECLDFTDKVELANGIHKMIEIYCKYLSSIIMATEMAKRPEGQPNSDKAKEFAGHILKETEDRLLKMLSFLSSTHEIDKTQNYIERQFKEYKKNGAGYESNRTGSA